MSDLNWAEHDLLLFNNNGLIECKQCGGTWKRTPVTKCPGIPVYAGEWSKVWPDGLMTKTQLRKAGYQTGRSLPPPVALLTWSKGPDGYLRLYDPADATLKQEPTQAQRGAIEKMQAALHEKRHCDRCKCRLESHESSVCDRCKMVIWAQEAVKEEAYILDSETTGLGPRAEIIELSIIDTSGHVHFDSLIQPRRPEAVHDCTPNWRGECISAYDIHGIGADKLRDAPLFEDVHMRLRQILSGQLVLVYNEAYDIPKLHAMCDERHLPRIDLRSDCVMLAYSQYVGQRRYERGRRGWSYKWQPLRGGDHSALGDCRATLELLQEMSGES